MFAITVGLTWPKEAFQPIFFASGYYVDVKMGDALTDTVVDGDEGAFCPKSLFDGTRQQLCVPEQWREELCWQVTECGEVLFGNEQTMPWKNWTMVQKREGDLILKHRVAGHFSANDTAEATIGRDRVSHELERV
jgi:hypothetical protein